MIFSEYEVSLIRGWEEPLAVCKGEDGPWENFVPDFRLVAPYRPSAAKRKKAAKTKKVVADAEQMTLDLFADAPPQPRRKPAPPPLAVQRKRAFDAFRFSLPKEVARVLEKFRSHQWNLLLLLSRQRAAVDLAASNPVLAYAVADRLADRPYDPRKVGKMPQRELLKMLRVPDTAANVRILRKIPPESLDRRLLPALLATLRSSDSAGLKWLHHVPRVNFGVMRLLLTHEIREGITPALLEEVAAEPTEKYRGNAAAMLSDILVMRSELADPAPLTAFRSLAALRRSHEEISAEFRKLDRLRTAYGNLPLPPLPGIPNKIVPLCTQSELIAEGRDQHNCIASYTAQVKARHVFIYRVLDPERATLAIHRGADSNWTIQEIKAKYNQPVCMQTEQFVKDWLEPYRRGL